MHICEFRIFMPLTLDEYKIGQLYATLKASLNETGGGEGVEIVENKPSNEGQYTKKLYHIETKVPRVVKAIAPKGALVLHEESWNSFPTGRTVINNPGYMKDDFYIKIRTKVQADDGQQENIFELDAHDLEKRKVVKIDIANDEIPEEDKKEGEDPRTFQSKETPPRGPLKADWVANAKPLLTVYKLVQCHFKWLFFQHKVEHSIIETQHRFFTVFHRRMFCWINEWIDMDIEDIRKMEVETQKELEKKRKNDKAKGVKEL